MLQQPDFEEKLAVRVAAKLKREAMHKLVECQKSDNTEEAHADADGVLCSLLDALGYGDVVAEYRRVPKWFA